MNFLKLADGHLHLNLAQVASIDVSDPKGASPVIVVALCDGRTRTLADKDARAVLAAIQAKPVHTSSSFPSPALVEEAQRLQDERLARKPKHRG